MVYYHFLNIQEFLQNCQIQTHLIQKFELNEKTRCQLFDIYVESVISYGSEIWGFHKSPGIERLSDLIFQFVRMFLVLDVM